MCYVKLILSVKGVDNFAFQGEVIPFVWWGNEKNRKL